MKIFYRLLSICLFCLPHFLWAQMNDFQAVVDLAIAKAPNHAAQIRHLQFDVEIAEKGRFDHFPNLGKQRLQKLEGIKIGQWYGKQTNSHVYMGAMNQMIHEIHSVKGKQIRYPRPTLFFWSDFYQDFVGTQCVSPLNYHARGFYQFTFKQTYFLQGQAVYQFAISPRMKADRLFTGIITLSQEGMLVSFDGSVESDAIDYRIHIQNQYKYESWLPLEANFNVHGGVLGITGEYEIQEKVKGDIQFWQPSVQDFVKPAEIKEVLNISDRAFDETFASQLLANFHQGLIRKWKLRPQSALTTVDSVKIVPIEVVQPTSSTFFPAPIDSSSIAYFDTLRRGPFRIDQLIFSNSFYFGKRKRDYYPFEIYYKSPVFDANFNTVEGFVVNSALVFRKRWERYRMLETEVLGRRSFGLNRNSGYLKLRYKTETIDLSASHGDFVAQFNPDNTISPEMNSLSTLLLKNNQMKIYRKQYWNVSLLKRFSSRLFIKGIVESAYRSQMDNSSGYYWINYLNRTFSSNNPTNVENLNEGFESNHSLITQFSIGLRPFLTQSYLNSTRQSDWGSSPLIQVKYRAGWPKVFGSKVNFQMLEFSYVQNLALSPWAKSGFVLNAGTFFGHSPEYFLDYKHFNGGLNLIHTGDMLASHRLIGYYQNFTSGANQRLNVNHYAYSTSGNYIEALSQFQFSNLWLKPLLGTKKAYVKEMLIANAVYLPKQNLFYQELGYGLDGVIKVLRLEAIANFSNGSFNYIGFRVNINSRIRIGNIPE